jgi:hypothetical protein
MPTTMLDEAVISLFPTVANAPQLWNSEIPTNNATYPRAIVRFSDETPNDPLEYNEDTGTPVESVAEFEFEIVTNNDPDGARTLALAIMAVYTPAAVTLTMDTAVRVLRVLYQPPKIIDQRGPGNVSLWMCLIRYRAMFGTSY